MCSLTLSDSKWTDGVGLSRLLLLPTVYTSTVTETNILSKDGKVWVSVKRMKNISSGGLENE